MISKAEEASAEYSLMLFSSAHISYWSQESLKGLQRRISERNYRFLKRLGWLRHSTIYEGQKIVKDAPGTYYLALIKGKEEGKREEVAHFKIVPKSKQGVGVTSGLIERHFEIAAEQLIAQEAARSAFALFSPTNTETFSDKYLIKEEGGYYTINPSEDAAEIIQFCGAPEDVVALLLGLGLIGAYPKTDEAIEKLSSPFKKNDNFTLEDQENFLNIFRQRIFYGTSGASSIPFFFIQGLNEAYRLCFVDCDPNGLNSYMSEIIKKNNPYRAFNEETETYEPTDFNNCEKWERNTHNQWSNIYSLWQERMKDIIKNKENISYEAAHNAFVRKFSQKTTVASLIAEAVGFDPLPLGPIVMDLDEVKEPEFFRSHLWSPYALSTQGPYHFGAEMVIRMSDYVLKNRGIDISQVRLFGPTFKTVFPKGYEEEFWKRQLRESKLLRDHLNESEEGNDSFYRVNLIKPPPEALMAINHYRPQNDR
jgi:hypothetical protein